MNSTSEAILWTLSFGSIAGSCPDEANSKPNLQHFCFCIYAPMPASSRSDFTERQNPSVATPGSLGRLQILKHPITDSRGWRKLPRLDTRALAILLLDGIRDKTG